MNMTNIGIRIQQAKDEMLKRYIEATDLNINYSDYHLLKEEVQQLTGIHIEDDDIATYMSLQIHHINDDYPSHVFKSYDNLTDGEKVRRTLNSDDFHENLKDD
jgi:hypothetical protein